MLNFAIGFVLGALIGVGTLALFSVNKDDDRDDYYDNDYWDDYFDGGFYE